MLHNNDALNPCHAKEPDGEPENNDGGVGVGGSSVRTKVARASGGYDPRRRVVLYVG